MKVSYFETGHYRPPRPLPTGWPLPPAEYDRGAGATAYRGMVERLRLVEQLGFDWISVAEHHYSHRRVTPAPAIVAAHLAAHSTRIKIAVLGPIVSHINPVRIAEEMALLDNLLPGRLVVGLLRGTTGEYLSYGLNPTEARERTTEAMELILKAWTEPQPFGWQGKYFKFRGVAVWPRPATHPHPPTYVLGTSRESCEFAARHRLGLRLSYASFPVIARAASYYRKACEREGWQPAPEQVIYRANVLLAESDAMAEATLQKMADQSPLPLPAAIGAELVRLDSRNIAGEARIPNIGGRLPTTFIGCPDTVIDQIKRCRDEAGVGVLDLFFSVRRYRAGSNNRQIDDVRQRSVATHPPHLIAHPASICRLKPESLACCPQPAATHSRNHQPSLRFQESYDKDRSGARSEHFSQSSSDNRFFWSPIGVLRRRARWSAP